MGLETGLSNPWNTRFSFFWYNDQEIFNDSPKDLSRKARTLAAKGINHVITFSCTHFRWSFMHDWDRIESALKRIVDACHENGISITEHHSAHLTYCPLTPEDEAAIQQHFLIRNSSLESWPGVRENWNKDPIIADGVTLSSMRQIDGRTGQWARTGYYGWAFCFNNPDYRKAYLGYLLSLYKTGIDGIMTDDVQYFGQGHACACKYCRSLYEKQTGNPLPPFGKEWIAWHGNYSDPTFLAWLDFRLKSVENFHECVKLHYDSLGIRPIRPNYNSEGFCHNKSAYCLEKLPDLDFVFQECNFPLIIRYSWPYWAAHAAFYSALGRSRNIPSMAMFYPHRPDLVRFCWGLAMAWGNLYLGTKQGETYLKFDNHLHLFEKKNAHLLFNPKPIARTGFYDSLRTRQISKNISTTVIHLMTWLQACIMRNYCFSICRSNNRSEIDSFDIIVLINQEVLSNEEIKLFYDFAIQGGTLIWVGNNGTFDTDGTERSLEDIWAHLKIAYKEISNSNFNPAYFNVGNGKIIITPLSYGNGKIEAPCAIDRYKDPQKRVPYKKLSNIDQQARSLIIDLLSANISGGLDLECINLPSGVIASVYCSNNGLAMVVHLLNATGTLTPENDGKASHDDLIPFPRHADNPQAHIKLRKPTQFSPVGDLSAWMHRPQQPKTTQLECEQCEDFINVRLNPAYIKEYVLIEIS